MKILFYSMYIGTATTTFLHNPFLEIAAKHETMYLCNEYYENSVLQGQNIKVIPFQHHRIRNKINWLLEKYKIILGFKNKAFAKQIKTLISEFKPDVIHCNFGNESLRLLENCFDSEQKYTIMFHGYDASNYFLSNSLYKKKYIELFSKPNVFPIVVSDYMKSKFVSAGIPMEKSLRLYYGCRLDLFKRSSYPVDKQEHIFLQVSSYSRQKGHTSTVQAFHLFVEQHPEIQCKLIFAGGGGTERNVVEALIKELHLEQKIITTDTLTPIEVKAYLESAHTFVHHSVTDSYQFTEGIPNAIIEAMAMELPILSTKHAGIPELVEDGKNGILVNEYDVKSYAQSFYDILDWKYKPENRKKVESFFSLKNHVENLENFYKKIIS